MKTTPKEKIDSKLMESDDFTLKHCDDLFDPTILNV